MTFEVAWWICWATVQPDHIEISVANPDEETLKRSREIMDKLKSWADLATIGGELSGEGPLWRYFYIVGDREFALKHLESELHHIDTDWREFLSAR